MIEIIADWVWRACTVLGAIALLIVASTLAAQAKRMRNLEVRCAILEGSVEHDPDLAEARRASSDPRGSCRNCGARYYLDASGAYVTYHSGSRTASTDASLEQHVGTITEESQGDREDPLTIKWNCPFCGQDEAHDVGPGTEERLAEHDD